MIVQQPLGKDGGKRLYVVPPAMFTATSAGSMCGVLRTDIQTLQGVIAMIKDPYDDLIKTDPSLASEANYHALWKEYLVLLVAENRSDGEMCELLYLHFEVDIVACLEMLQDARLSLGRRSDIRLDTVELAREYLFCLYGQTAQKYESLADSAPNWEARVSYQRIALDYQKQRDCIAGLDSKRSTTGDDRNGPGER